ncbi:hypothetical protein MAR_004432 [Mya arenaria]|uniref:Uncharacterized protein n=1 Tax=Mya arenaria TaxID=6604 RepID=A0ABY7EYD8_MYAAR|nr:hypothetical protein MAR_004432 [Mya arenaria]
MKIRKDKRPPDGALSKNEFLTGVSLRARTSLEGRVYGFNARWWCSYNKNKINKINKPLLSYVAFSIETPVGRLNSCYERRKNADTRSFLNTDRFYYSVGPNQVEQAVVYCDASGAGFGGFLEDVDNKSVVMGCWSQTESGLSSTFRKL